MNDNSSFDGMGTSGELVPLVNNSNPLSSDVITNWIGRAVLYNSIKNYLENHYRSPIELRDAHDNAIATVSSMLIELDNIAQSLRRLNKSESALSSLLDQIGNPYNKPETIRELEEIDKKIESGFKGMPKDTYAEISSCAKAITNYVIDKLYLSLVERVESMRPESDLEEHERILFHMHSKKSGPSSNDVLKQLCEDVLSDFGMNESFPLPALEMNIYQEGRLNGMEGRMINNNTFLNDVGVFGPAKTSSSNIIYLWQNGKAPQKMWISSICGRALAYASGSMINNETENKVKRIMSVIRSQSKTI